MLIMTWEVWGLLCMIWSTKSLDFDDEYLYKYDVPWEEWSLLFMIWLSFVFKWKYGKVFEFDINDLYLHYCL